MHVRFCLGAVMLAVFCTSRLVGGMDSVVGVRFRARDTTHNTSHLHHHETHHMLILVRGC
jgi:hypothetical protein